MKGRATGHRRGVRTIGWILALATAGGSGGLAPRSALADEPASFEWNAPLSCPTREAVLDRLGRGSAPGATRRIDTRVTVEQDGEDHYQARVDLVAGHQWSNRSLEASTCEAIADAVVVIVRVAAAAIPPDPLPAVAPPAAPPPTPAASPAPPSSAWWDAVDEYAGRGFTVRSAFALDAGTRFDATPGFAIGAAWRGAHVAFGLDLRAFAPPPAPTAFEASALVPELALNQSGVFAGAMTGAVTSPIDAQVWLLTASLEACASEPLRRGRLVVDACLGLTVERPRFSSDKLGLVPMSELAAEWWPMRSVGLRASTRWLLDIPRSVPITALVAFEPTLGVVMHLGK
jgi:hypothetical protein